MPLSHSFTVWPWLQSCIFLSVLQLILASLTYLLDVSVLYDTSFISICLLSTFVFLFSAQPSSLPAAQLQSGLPFHSFSSPPLPLSLPFASEKLILQLPAPPLTYSPFHSTHLLCSFPIPFPLLPALNINHLLFKTALIMITLSLHATLH